MRDGIPYTVPVDMVRRGETLIVDLYDYDNRMTKAVKRAVRKGLLKRSGGTMQAAQFNLTDGARNRGGLI